MPEKPAILVIDDELGPRESLRFLFKDQYDVACAESVDQAIAHLAESQPDCIISDIKMPGKTGLDGLREIRTRDEDVSIIMLTGFGSLETAQEAIRYGASDYVKKPFDARDMRTVVADHVQKTQFKRRQRKAYENLQNLNDQLKTELDAKEHMASLGQASSEFIHDLRNPLTVICGYVGLLMRQIRDTENTASSEDQQRLTLEYLEQLEENVQRCQEMSQTWREISSQESASTNPVSLDQVLLQVTKMISQIASEQNVNVSLQPTEPVTIQGNELQLFRALHNIASNALQAVPHDGSGRLQLELTTPQEHAVIHIEDNGPGIAPEQLERVFTPYVSSRKQQGGMGLGLFIARKILEAHNGSVQLKNKPEGGLRATITLPVTQES